MQLQEGMVEDAESQIELLSVMQSAEELSPEFLYLRYVRYRDRQLIIAEIFLILVCNAVLG